MEQTAAEIKRLQGCINDLISVLALAALWSGHEPSQIIRTLLDVLLGMLRLDFAYVRLSDAIDSPPIEVVRTAQRRTPAVPPQEVGRALNRWLTGAPAASSVVVANPVGEGEVSIASCRLGLQGEVGVLVAGSERADFPTEIERLLLHVAVNQAAIGLQEARRVSEQRRAAEELEHRVAERTRQLTAVNEELRKEIIERRRSEQRLATQYAITRVLAQSDTLADAMPRLLQAIGESLAWEWGALWTTDHDAGVLRCKSLWHAPNLQATELNAISRQTAGMPGQGLKGRVWQNAKPTWIADATQDPYFAQAPVAARAGPHGAIAFPILLHSETVGVMEFFSRAIRQPDEEQLAMLSAFGNQIGQFVERKRVEEERMKLAALVENSTDFIGITSPEGQVLFVNPAGQRMVGLEGNEQVRATRILDYVAEQDRESVQQQVLPAVARDGRWEGEMRFRHFQTGAAIPMLHHVFFIKEPSSDRPVVLATISRDITERKQVEEKLRDSECRFRVLAEVIPQQVWGYLPDDSLNYCNQRWMDYFDLTLSEAQRQGWTTGLHPADVEPALQAWREAASQKQPYEVEVRLLGADGHYRRFLSRGVPLYDNGGQLMQCFGTNTGIEDRKQAEEALHKTRAELAHATRVMTMGELTASISHEVNQPLTAVVINGDACLQWLAHEPPALEEARAAAERIIRDGHRASEVIRRIRMLSKSTAPQKTPLDINDVIHEVLTLVHSDVLRHQVSLRTELSAALPPVLGDRIQVQQVILNLTMNSIEAMDAVTDRSRELLIRSQRHASDTLLVAVRDSGIGLDPQTLDKLFDAFFTTKPEGMGLGLSISRTIIEAHGGRLWATSNDGHGATMLFTLPTGSESMS